MTALMLLVRESAKFVTPGHPEIELALVKLYEITGENRYLELSKFFIDEIPNKQVVFVCHSWLLYTATLEVFPKHSNTYRFIHEFDVTWNSEDKEGEYNDAWRLFDMDQFDQNNNLYLFQILFVLHSLK